MSVSGLAGAALADGGFATLNEEEALAIAKERGQEMEVFNLDPGELEKWIEVGGKPVWAKWVADMEAKGKPGQKILDKAFNLREKYK